MTALVLRRGRWSFRGVPNVSPYAGNSWRAAGRGGVWLLGVVMGCASSGSSLDDVELDGQGTLGGGRRLSADFRDEGRRRAPAAPVLDVEARDYAPMAVGANWTYETNVLGDTTKGSVQIRITDKVKGFYRDSAGAEYKHTARGLRDRIRYLIRNPLQQGKTWKATLSAAAVEHYTIESIGQPCDTRAGRFPDCLVVKAFQRRNDRETQHVTYTWVRSVGLARILVEGEIKGKGRFRQSELSLVNYSLSGQRPPPADEDGAPSEWKR